MKSEDSQINDSPTSRMHLYLDAGNTYTTEDILQMGKDCVTTACLKTFTSNGDNSQLLGNMKVCYHCSQISSRGGHFRSGTCSVILLANRAFLGFFFLKHPSHLRHAKSSPQWKTAENQPNNHVKLLNIY